MNSTRSSWPWTGGQPQRRHVAVLVRLDDAACRLLSSPDRHEHGVGLLIAEQVHAAAALSSLGLSQWAEECITTGQGLIGYLARREAAR